MWWLYCFHFKNHFHYCGYQCPAPPIQEWCWMGHNQGSLVHRWGSEISSTSAKMGFWLVIVSRGQTDFLRARTKCSSDLAMRDYIATINLLLNRLLLSIIDKIACSFNFQVHMLWAVWGVNLLYHVHYTPTICSCGFIIRCQHRCCRST